MKNLPALPNSIEDVSGESFAAGLAAFELFQAIGTDAMSKVGLGVFREVDFHLLPVALVVPYPFAGRTNRQQPAQRFDLLERFSQFLDQLDAFRFIFPAPGDVPRNGRGFYSQFNQSRFAVGCWT